MSLKLIPVEPSANQAKGEKQKNFNPGNKIKKNTEARDSGLKAMCLRIVHFINRGSKFTHQQIDELIMTMQRNILSLQKKKREIIKKKK